MRLQSILRRNNRIRLHQDELRAISMAMESKGLQFAQEKYDSDLLNRHLELWDTLVSEYWTEDFEPEYFHDIGVRSSIQVVLDNSSHNKSKIEQRVLAADKIFKKKMVPIQRPYRAKRHDPNMSYFWETNTLLPAQEPSYE